MKLLNANLSLALLPLLTTAALAQQSVLFSQSGDGNFVRNGGNGNLTVGQVFNETIHMVSPLPGVEYSAGPFLGQGAQYVFLGDTNGDSDFVRSAGTGAWGTMDAVFVRRTNPFGTVGPHEAFHSFAAPSFDIGTRTVNDGDILRFPSNYDVELFLFESTIAIATGADDPDIDAICQDDTGNLYFSFADTETVVGVSQTDGALFYIDATDITYNAQGNVIAMNADSAQLVATETDMNALVAAAGAMDADATAITSIADLGALEIDPGGGTFMAPADPGLVLPNLLFGSSDSARDLVVFSTAGGGTIGVINGVTMGSTVATVGFHMGLRSTDSSGPDALTGLGLIPFRNPPFVCENSRNESTSSGALFFRSEVAGATPGATVGVFMAFPDLGDRFSITAFPSLYGGEFFGAGGPVLTMGQFTADSLGYGGISFNVPPGFIGNVGATVWQAFDLTAFGFSHPAIYQF